MNSVYAGLLTQKMLTTWIDCCYSFKKVSALQKWAENSKTVPASHHTLGWTQPFCPIPILTTATGPHGFIPQHSLCCWSDTNTKSQFHPTHSSNFRDGLHVSAFLHCWVPPGLIAFPPTKLFIFLQTWSQISNQAAVSMMLHLKLIDFQM